MTAVLARLIGAVGLFATLAVGAMLLVAPDLPGIRTLAATGAVGLAGWLYLDWPAVAGWAASRGGAELARSVALIAVLVGIAAVSVRIADRIGIRWDVTPSRTHSVQERTAQILGELTVPVFLTAFYVAEGDAIERAHRARWAALSEAFDAASASVSVATFDPDVSRREAAEANVRSNGVVLVQAADRTERLFAPDEASLLNAILRVAAARDRAVYFTSGSGERAPTEAGRTGLAQLAARLRALGLRVETLDVRRAQGIPDDAAAVLLVDPATPLDPGAADTLATFVDAGGALLVAAEPQRPTGLETHLARWGLRTANAVVVDPLVRAVVGDATSPLVARYGVHASVRGLRAPALFNGAAPVQSTDYEPTKATVHALAETSELAWGETNPARHEQDDADLPGPLSLLSLVELHPAGVATGMVVLSGDADWLSDPAMEELGNGDLAIRVLGHLGRQADLVKLPPRDRPTGTLSMDWMARVVLGIVAVLLVPGVCFGAGVGLWMRRRRL